MSPAGFGVLAASLPLLQGLTYSCCELPGMFPPQPSMAGWLSKSHLATICRMTRLTQLQLCVNGLETAAVATLLVGIPRMLCLREVALAFTTRYKRGEDYPEIHPRWTTFSPFSFPQTSTSH